MHSRDDSMTLATLLRRIRQRISYRIRTIEQTITVIQNASRHSVCQAEDRRTSTISRSVRTFVDGILRPFRSHQTGEPKIGV